MFQNYFKTAWRHLLRNKGYSALNILGLGTGMAVALLIGLWVHHEYSYDKFLPDYERLYQVRRNFNSNGDILNFPTTSLALADALRNEIPEIEYVAETDWMNAHGLKVDDKKIYLEGGQVNGDFLKMFRYPLVKGTAETVLQDPYSIVLTESTAQALFGNEDPLNQFVRFDNKNDLKVTGILKDLPANSTFKFKYLVPFSYFEATEGYVKQQRQSGFSENSYQIFTKLKPGTTYAQVAPKIKNIQKRQKDSFNAQHSEVIMQPMQNWHLYSEYVNGKDTGGFIEYVRMFGVIGVLILLIACINFINLTTARSEKRAREVGVRKAIGSQRKDLVIQFLAESLVFALLAFVCALIMVQLALPAFNTLIGSIIKLPVFDLTFWLITLGSVLLVALLAGSRPAFYFSSFNPVKVLKGSLHVGKAAALPRKILVVLQFSCSIALIISTIIIYRQIQYAKDRPTGYDLTRLLVTEINNDLIKNYTVLKNELQQQGIVASMTQASSPATGIYWHGDIDRWPGKHAGESVEMGFIRVADDYFKTLGITIPQGRDFTGISDTISVIFNQAAIKRMRIKEPVNQTITFNGQPMRIVGVAKDALMTSPFAAAEPTMFMYSPYPQTFITYRLAPNIKTQNAIARLSTIFNKYSPAFPFSYQFADQSYAEKFNLEVLIGKLAGIFASLAIFISCLGLFGLAAFMAEQRTKEIGIRKVLGASVQQVWLLLSKDFMLLVLISCIIASPVALYFLQNWLQKYTYRISIGPEVFMLAAVLALVITILTISFQAIKAAMANPVKSLRTE
ncbi:ABC transporter permease [Adhaeribacter pallidiroseus]|uniref:Macrolide export ATP-binding/permease protein MacB n=1 Tax=Adhaeribacter pallidiroseus TaxID=2072847 RepID=A0A369QLL0_9BACT|nr:ABC transporter permease [Adhaeribacter pallidiroseus]RDC65594.1 Macrolide export ATP-binding/permease protein MacB [Adhaeribacter pallidiroseus]